MKLLILQEKHGDFYHLCRSDLELCEALIHIFNERNDAGYFYTPEDLAGVETPRQIVSFMYNRTVYEYENFEVETIEFFKELNNG